VASREPAGGERRPSYEPMLDQRLPRVLGAARHEPARAWQQGPQQQL